MALDILQEFCGDDPSQVTKSENLPFERWFVPSRDPDKLIARPHRSWEVLRQFLTAGLHTAGPLGLNHL